MPGDARTIAVVGNAGAGAGADEAASAQRRVEEIFRAAGRDVRGTIAPNLDSLRRVVDEAIAAKVAAIVAGGGDGTVSIVGAALAGRDIPLGVIPLGTLNHFAKDLGLPLDVDEAAAVVLAGRTARVDVAEVNGRIFLNNSSVGIYPQIVRLRERHPARGFGKWVVAAWAVVTAMSRNSVVAVRVTMDDHTIVRRTPLVFVGNNEYRMTGFDAGSRESLSGGRLAIYVVKAGGRGRLLGLVWKIIVGRAHDADELDVLHVAAATIDTKARRLQVACDGEVEKLEAPLEYRIRPSALEVFVPGD